MGDARRLLTVWYLRKTFHSWMALGLIGLVADAWWSDRATEDLAGGWSAPDQLAGSLFSPVAGLVIGLTVRLVTSNLALVLAWPLVLRYEDGLSERTSFGHQVTVFLDRLNLARAHRSLRWTHHVRQEALARLPGGGRRVGRLDPVLDITNVTLVTLALVTLVVYAAVAG